MHAVHSQYSPSAKLVSNSNKINLNLIVTVEKLTVKNSERLIGRLTINMGTGSSYILHLFLGANINTNEFAGCMFSNL